MAVELRQQKWGEGGVWAVYKRCPAVVAPSARFSSLVRDPLLKGELPWGWAGQLHLF